MTIKNSLIVGVLFFLSSCASVDREIDFEPPVFPPPPEQPRFIWERVFVSSGDVKERTAMDRFRQLATGTAGTSKGMNKPWDVTVYQGRIYVTDTVARLVVMFDVPGRDFKLIGSEGGPGQIIKPTGITVDRIACGVSSINWRVGVAVGLGSITTDLIGNSTLDCTGELQAERLNIASNIKHIIRYFKKPEKRFNLFFPVAINHSH